MMPMYKNIICFFSFQNVHMGRVRESQRWLKCTHTGAMVWFFCEISLPFCFILSKLKSSVVYIIFQTPTQSFWLHVSPMHCMWTHLLSSMPPTQLTWHFHWGNTCILFTLGNRCTFCCFSASSIGLCKHATDIISTAFPLGYLFPVYFRRQVYFLLYYPRNLHGMSKRVFKLIFNTITLRHYIYIYIYIYI